LRRADHRESHQRQAQEEEPQGRSSRAVHFSYLPRPNLFIGLGGDNLEQVSRSLMIRSLRAREAATLLAASGCRSPLAGSLYGFQNRHREYRQPVCDPAVADEATARTQGTSWPFAKWSK
jgi:hypothetical protein